MQLPFIKYLEAMVACKQPIEQVYDSLQNLKVALASEFPREGIIQVYEKLSETNREYFEKRNKLPDINWLKEFEIDKMVGYHLRLELPGGVQGIRGAFEILNDANMYQTITALALAKITEEDIELIVNGKYNIHYEPEDVKEFLHYFFNVKDWTLTRKKDYIKMINDPKLVRVYNLAVDGDKDYLVWKLGVAPDRSFDQMLREMMADSFYNFKEKMKADPDSARKWGDLAIKITDRIDKLDKESKDKKNLFDDLVFTINNTPINKVHSESAAKVADKEKFLHIDELSDN